MEENKAEGQEREGQMVQPRAKDWASSATPLQSQQRREASVSPSKPKHSQRSQHVDGRSRVEHLTETSHPGEDAEDAEGPADID